MEQWAVGSGDGSSIVQSTQNPASALRRAIDQSGDVDPNTQQFDILAATRYWKGKFPIKWTSKHVQGHQDDNP